MPRVEVIELNCRNVEHADGTWSVEIFVGGLDEHQADLIAAALRGPLTTIIPAVLAGTGTLVGEVDQLKETRQ